jgi:hypothetical protein
MIDLMHYTIIFIPVFGSLMLSGVILMVEHYPGLQPKQASDGLHATVDKVELDWWPLGPIAG